MPALSIDVTFERFEEDLLPPFGEKLVDDAPEDLVAEAAVKRAVQNDDDDVLCLPDRDVHGPSILAPSGRERTPRPSGFTGRERARRIPVP